MIPSESATPVAVRESLGSIFTNIYAEGYPPPETQKYTEEEILITPTCWACIGDMATRAFTKAWNMLMLLKP